MPRVPSSNSSSSFAIADGRPVTRAIPSAHWATVPTSSLLAASGLKSSTYFDSASRISSGRIVSSVISSLLSWLSGLCEVLGRRSSGEPPPGVVEPARDGAVDDVVADLDAYAAEDVGVDDDVEMHGGGVLLAEGLGQPPLVGVAHRPRDPDRRDLLALRLRRDLPVGRERAGDGAVRAGQRLLDQRDRRRQRLAVEQGVDQRGLVVDGASRV